MSYTRKLVTTLDGRHWMCFQSVVVLSESSSSLRRFSDFRGRSTEPNTYKRTSKSMPSQVQWRALVRPISSHSVRQPVISRNVALLPSVMLQQHSGLASQSDSSSSGASDELIAVRYQGNFVVFEMRIPGTSERRRFVLRRYTDRLSDLCAAVNAERSDSKSEIQVKTASGEQLASSTPLDVVFKRSDQLLVVATEGGREEPLGRIALASDSQASSPALEHVEQLRLTIDSLFETLNVPAFRKSRRETLEGELRSLKTQMQPLEKLRAELQKKASRAGKRFAWVGFGYMGVQAGVLARLTWWEYSWDIVEPISYFVTYATSMFFFAYYLLTRQEWTFPEAEDRHALFKLHKVAKRNQFDANKYNTLKLRICEIEEQLRELDSPGSLQLAITSARANA